MASHIIKVPDARIAAMTRIWEFSDNHAMPTDLVREQDFILRLRRMHRLGTPHFIVNIHISAVAASVHDRTVMEGIERALTTLVTASHGVAMEMSNGDLFLVWDHVSAGQSVLPRLTALMPEGKTDYVQTYTLPADYMVARERANTYVEMVQNHTLPPESIQALHGDAARGPLTAWSLDQIGKLLGDISLSDYTRIQPIYRRNERGLWLAEREEHFIGFDDLRRDHFPKLDLVASQHLFLALCETLDQRLLLSLYKNHVPFAGQAITLNLSIATVIDSAFARFVVTMPQDQRAQIGFELQRGDLLQDFAQTLDAIKLLKQEGFTVILDGITPDLTPYLDLTAFGADFIKINVARDRTEQLTHPPIRQALARIPVESLIFFRCDSDAAITAGEELGVTLFQGWRIDERVRDMARF